MKPKIDKYKRIASEGPNTLDLLDSVYLERLIQDKKWGIQNHKQMIWLGILLEEVGEAAKDINELHFRPSKKKPKWKQMFKIYKELIQVAAVAVAMIESLTRNGE